MKKIVLVLTILLLAVPAMATTVDITATQDGNEVTIAYEISGSPKVRAFALDLQVDSGNTIVEVNDYFTGECDDVNRGYGIFMGSIDLSTPSNPIWNTPVAPGSAPDDPCQLGSDGITIEMGSLYTGANSPPDPCGTLCTIRVGSDSGCTLTISANGLRGGIVLEDPDVTPTTNLPLDVNLTFGCFPSDHPDRAEWDAFGGPECWCGSGRQCHGDGDDFREGTLKGGYFYVGAGDLVQLFAGWRVLEPPKGPGIVSVPDGICADYDHAQEGTLKGGYFRVGAGDLAILFANWRVLEPPKGPGLPPDCLDVP